MRCTRVLLAALVPLFAACGTDVTSNPSGGRTRVLLTDAPFPYDRIARVDVHIVRVQVAASADTSDPNESWTTIAEPNRTINLLELQSGTTTLLGETEVTTANVGAVRVIMNTALSSVTDNAGQAVQVHWPLLGEISLHAYVQSSLALFEEGTEHNLVIDFDVGRSFADIHGNGSLTFIPWIRVIDDAGAGSVSGTVRGAPTPGTSALQPMANVAVTVLQGDPDGNPLTWYKVATGKTDAQGRYKVAFILHGEYIVRAEPLGNTAAGCMDKTGVIVSNGASTTVDLDLPAAPGTCARFTGSGGGPDSTGSGGSGGSTGGAVAAVAVTVWPQTLAVGDSAGAYANLTNAQGASLYNRAVSWTISDANVIDVKGVYGQSLVFRAKAAGTATLTATSEGISASRTVVVQ